MMFTDIALPAYVGLVVIAAVGFTSAILLSWIERVLVPWKHV